MSKQTLSLILIGLVLNLIFYPTSIKANNFQDDKEAKFAEKVKKELGGLGIGTSIKVKVKLKDGRKLKGYVSEHNVDTFSITDKNNQVIQIPYLQVKEIRGENSSTGKKILQVLGVTLLLIWLGGWIYGCVASTCV